MIRSFIFLSILFFFFQAEAQYNSGPVGFAALNGGTTGGSGGKEVTVSNYADLKKYAEEPETKYVIHVEGTIIGSGSIAKGDYDGSIKVASNKTLLGVGNTALLKGMGIMVSNAHNIILRNLKVTLTGIHIPDSLVEKDIPGIYSAKGDEGRAQILVNAGDCISIQKQSTNIWIDHCEVFNEDPATQLNIDLYDGLIDIKNTSSFITISWCYLHDHHKCHLVGSSDKDEFDRKVTFHHNYYRNIDERLPSFRFGAAHIFNNYYENLRVGGINSRMGACLKIESNLFKDSKDPIGTRNSKTVGQWEVKDNKFDNCTGSMPDSSNCSLEIPYEYKSVLTKVAALKELLLQHAGVEKKLKSPKIEAK